MGNGKDKLRLEDLEGAVANGDLKVEPDDLRARRINTLRWLNGWEELPDPLPEGVLLDKRQAPYITVPKEESEGWVEETHGLSNQEVGDRYIAENLPWPLPTGRIALDTQGRPYLRSQGPEGRGGEKLSCEKVWKIYRNEIRDLDQAAPVSFTEFPDQAPPGVQYFGSGDKQTAWLIDKGRKIRQLSPREVWHRVEAVGKAESERAPEPTAESSPPNPTPTQPAPKPTAATPPPAGAKPAKAEDPTPESQPSPEPTRAPDFRTSEFDEAYRLITGINHLEALLRGEKSHIGIPEKEMYERRKAQDEQELMDLQKQLSDEQIIRLLTHIASYQPKRVCEETGKPFDPYVTDNQKQLMRQGAFPLTKLEWKTVSREGLKIRADRRRTEREAAVAATPPAPVAQASNEPETPAAQSTAPAQSARSTKARKRRVTEKRADVAEMHRPAEPDIDPRDQRRHRQPAVTKATPTVTQPVPSSSTPASATPSPQVHSSPILSPAEEAAAEEMTQAARRMRERTAALRERLAS